MRRILIIIGSTSTQFPTASVYICICNAVTERAICAAAADGARTVDALAFELGVGAGCGGCRDAAQFALDECERKQREARTAKIGLYSPLRSAA